MAKKLLREVLVPMWCRKILKILTRRNSSKSSNKRQLHILRRRRRKRKIASLVASSGIMLGTARRVSGSPKKYANMVEADEEHRGMIIYYLQFFQFIIHLIGGLTQELISMCVLIFLCFLLIRSGEVPPC